MKHHHMKNYSIDTISSWWLLIRLEEECEIEPKYKYFSFNADIVTKETVDKNLNGVY